MSIERLGSIWPEWSVIEKIGEGSFGKVYRVMREEHGFTDYAAVKVITIPQNPAELNSLEADGYDESSARSYFEGIVTDFVSEIKLMVSMKGTANIVSVEDYKVVEKSGEIGWDIYIRMELLTSFIDYSTGKKLSQDEIIKLGQDICSALELCSWKKIIHRDIKPENIFVSEFGDFKLGDFGIARELEKTSGSMSAKGTYNYIAPEIPKSKRYDATVDIYSLGLVLYKLLNNNRLPFIDPATEQIMYQDRKDAVDRRLSGERLLIPVDASEEMAHALLKACMYDPSLRFRTATEFKQALESVKNGTYEIVPFAADTLNETGPIFDYNRTVTGRPISGNHQTEAGMGGTFRDVDDLNTFKNDTDEFVTKSKFNKNAIIVACIICVCVILITLIWAQPWNRSVPEDPPEPPPPVISDEHDDGNGEIIEDNDPDNSDTEASSPISQNLTNNIHGNIVNGGLVAIQGEWIYYVNDEDYGTVYTMRIDGSDRRKLSNDLFSGSINILDGKLYYSYDYYEINDGSGINSINFDGSDIHILCNDYDVGYINVIDNYIYYFGRSWDYSDGIFAISIDGTERRKLSDDTARYITVINDWIYYSNENDDWKIYALNIDGSDKQKLNNDHSIYINIIDDWIYYINESDEGRIYVIRADGSERHKVNNDKASSLNVTNNRIYYVNVDDGYKIYSMNPDGSDRRKLNDDMSSNINIIGDWIFYKNLSVMYTMRIDGSDRRPLTEWMS